MITDDQIKAESIRIAAMLGSAVHLKGRDVAESLDSRTVAVLTDAEYETLLTRCNAVAEDMRAQANHAMWG